MASGTLGVEESRESREKQRWGDNKVYTRKNHKKGIKSTTTTTNNNNGTINQDSVPQQSSQTLATTTEDGNSLQQQEQNLSRLDGASDDSSTHNHAEVTMMPNGAQLVNGNNGLNSIFTRFENRVKVNVSAARSKSEVGEVRRKLASELELVRILVQKLEAKEVQLNGYSSIGGYSSGLQVPTNEDVDRGAGPLMVNSEVGSVGQCDSRPFHGLSVVVTESNHDGSNEFNDKDKRTPMSSQYYLNSEFVSGKEKFPPLEGNKRLKPNGIGLGMQLSQAFKSCSNLLTRLVKHKHSWVFKAPVDVEGLGLHDYHTIIKHPMDLGTIRTKLTMNCYKSPREFAEDVRLTFRNAMTYNPKGHDVHTMAEEYLKIFEEKWAVIEADYNLDWMSDMSREKDLQTPTSRKVPTPHPLPPAPPSQVKNMDNSIPTTTPVDSRMGTTHISPPGPGRKPAPKKPKAKKLRKRDMTFEEKQKLSIHLQSLPSEKLDNIVQIIKKRNSDLSQHDDEIEVDIDSVDAETLWELDRFVSNYKKSLSKLKRKAEIALQARLETDHTEQDMNPVPVVVEVEAPKETREESAVEGDKQGNNDGRSNSSSSSSSGSESSSSDSDSESSSASESDAGHSPRT